MLIYPKIYLENATKISEKIIKENNIKGIILDVDNTLLYYNREMLENVDIWCNNLKEKGIKFCIVSNSNKKDKIKMIAEKLKIPYISFGMKPLKFGLKKAQRILKLDSTNIAVVGDKIFTDIIGANRCKMFSILVKPLEEKDILITRIKRPIENAVIKRYVKQEEEEENVHKWYSYYLLYNIWDIGRRGSDNLLTG